MDPTLSVVLIFLLICLISGLYAGRKTKNFAQFAVGDKQSSKMVLAATLIATDFGGGFMFRDLEQIYTNGLYYALIGLSYIGYYLFGNYMAYRMGEFMHHHSIAESMRYLYGRIVGFITATSGLLFSAGMVAIQLNTISRIIQTFCDIKGNIPTYIAIVIVLAYSTFGGIKAVAFTDVIQLLTFCTIIPVLIYITYKGISNYESILSILTSHPKFALDKL